MPPRDAGKQPPKSKAKPYTIKRSGTDAGSGAPNDSYGLKKAERFKKTKAYRGAVGAASHDRGVRTTKQEVPLPGRPGGGPARPAESRIKVTVEQRRKVAPYEQRKARIDAIQTRQRATGRSEPLTTRGPALHVPHLDGEDAIISHLHDARVQRNAALTNPRRSQFTGIKAGEREVVNRFNVDRLLSKDTQDAMYQRELRKRQEGPRLLPNTKGAKMPDSAAKEATAKRLTTDLAGFGAGAPEILKALSQLDTRRKSPAIAILEQFTRPASGVASGTRALLHAENPVKIATEIAKGVAQNDTSFSDLLAEAHAPKWVQAVGGLGLDIALDPTTYLTLGTGVPALAAAKGAQRAARAAGATETAALKVARAVYDAHPHKARGVQIGLRGMPVRAVSLANQLRKGARGRAAWNQSTRQVTSKPFERVSSTAARKARLVPARDPGKVKDRIGRSLIYSYRPKDVHPVDWEHIRTSALGYRAERGHGERIAVRRGTAFQRYVDKHKLDPAAVWHVVRAHERANPEGLSPVQRRLYDILDGDLSAITRQEVDAGIRDAGALVGASTRPEIPAVTADVEGAAQRLREAVRTRADLEKATRQWERSQGRAEILSRNVGGVRAERAAERSGRQGSKLPSREDFITNRVKPAGDSPIPTVESLTQNVKPGRPGISAESEYVRRRYRDGADAGFGNELAGTKVFVYRDDAGRPLGALRVTEDGAGKADILEVAVAPHAQKQGIASRLYDAAARAGYDVEAASGRHGLTEAGAALKHKRLSEAANKYAGGGYGVRQAAQRIDGRTLKDARAAIDTRAAELTAERTLLREQKLARKRAERAGAHWDKLPRGYFPRMPATMLEEGDGLAAAATRRGSAGRRSDSGDSHHRRQGERAWSIEAQMAAGKEIPYAATNIAAPMSRRIGESFRNVAIAGLHNKLAALGRPVASVDDVFDAGGSLDTVLVREQNGFRPVTKEVDTAASATQKVQKALDDGHEVIAVPTRTWDLAWEQADRGRSSAELGMGARAFDRVQGTLKTGQTVINPGYHVTNLIGDAFNARLSGTRFVDMANAARMVYGRERKLENLDRDLAHAINSSPPLGEGKTAFYKGLGSNATDAEIVDLARKHGAIQMGFAGNELHALNELAGPGKRWRPMERLRFWNELREDVMRLGTFRSALKRGEHPEDAAAIVNRHHFDYGDLTEFERSTMRRLIPYYTFMARNAPLQARSLVASPGRYATVEKTRDTLANATGLDENFASRLPRYLQAQVPFPIPKLPFVNTGGLPLAANLKLPLNDLNLLPISGDLNGIDPSNWPDEFGQRMTTLLKFPLEQWTGYDFFFKDKVKNKLVAAPSWVMHPEIKNTIESLWVPGMGHPKVTMIEDRKTGKMVPGWSWRMDKLVRLLPLTGALANITTPGKSRHGKGALGAASWVAGPRPFALDPNEARVSQLFEDVARWEDEVKQLGATVHHKSGQNWHGKIARRNKQIAKAKQDIAGASKAAGYADPYFAEQLGTGSRKKGTKSFGATPLTRRKAKPFGVTK